MTTKGTPEEIGSTPGIGPPKEIQPEEEQPKPGQPFETYMKEGPEKPGAAKPEGVAPFELAGGGVPPGAGPTMETIATQMNSVSSILGDVQTQLNTKNLKLKQSQKYLLRNKLSSANENIRTAADKTGVDIGKPPSTSLRQNPIKKFLALISDGQIQLNNAQNMIQNLGKEGKPLNPGDLLLIQIKLAKAQQELEYSSVLLSKAVDDIKTMFNIQL